MSRFAELPDGKRLEFPDDTLDEVIQATVRRELGLGAPTAPIEAPTQPPGPPTPQLPLGGARSAGLESLFSVGGSAIAEPASGLAGIAGLLQLDPGAGAQAAPVSAPEDTGFSVAETISNIPSSAAQFATDIFKTVTSPIETGKAILSLADALGNKIGRNVAEIVQGQELEPIESRSESVADAVGQAAIDRFGSIDAIKNTLQNDPVGFLADISGFGMAAGALPKLGKVQKVAAALEPTTLAAKTVRAVTKAVIPQNAANKLFQSAAKFSTTLTPKQRNALVNTAVQQELLPTPKGVQKLQNRIEVLDSRLDASIADATRRGVEIPVNAIFSHFKDLRAGKGGVKAEAARDLRVIDRIARDFNQSLRGRKTVTPEEMQAFKIDAYRKIKWDANRLTGSPIKEDTLKAMARGAKDSLEKAVKDAPEINKALGDLLKLQKPLAKASARLENRNLLSINTPLSVGAGGIVGDILGSGGVGLSAGFIAAALGNPKVKARIALALNKLKEGDVEWLDANINRSETVIALALASRGSELIKDQETNPEDNR